FIEKILRIQPDIQKLYVLLRASNSDLAAHRLQNEFLSDIPRASSRVGEDFTSFTSKKVVAIAGDVAIENFGIKDEKIKNEIFEEIDVLVHSAASTKLDERTIDSVIYSYGQGKLKSFVGDLKTILDDIPVDMVINCVIAAIFIHSNQPPKNFIYHVSSSLRNPLKYSDIQKICHRYFMKTPWINQNGKPIVISNAFRVNSFVAFNIYMIVTLR
ncbi:hypothetical protein RYX36_003191, partial [Vicia faba]